MVGALAVRGLHTPVDLLANEVPLGLAASKSSVVPFSQSLSTLALIEEFLGKREVPPPPGAEGQGVQKWVRNISYFREFIAALFPEPWQGLLKASSFSLSSLLYSPSDAWDCLWLARSREILGMSSYRGGPGLRAGCLGESGRAQRSKRPRPCVRDVTS